jgi:autotransporter-associated beta strand protein
VTRGLFVYNGQVSISDLTIQNAIALGGGGSGGGAGLGGGLFVAGANSGTTGGNVTLDGVTFTDDAAQGGLGGDINFAGMPLAGGGGGLEGYGFLGGGGVGSDGGSTNFALTTNVQLAGIIVGAAGGGDGFESAATSGSSGGFGGVSTGGASAGGGGGVGGAPASEATGGGGGFGGGGGGSSPSGQGNGGTGGFGGGGGGASFRAGSVGGAGGFGGGGGSGSGAGSASLFDSNPTNAGAGGFGGGAGGGVQFSFTVSDGGMQHSDPTEVGVSGGGGLGAGGAIFVQAGGKLTIAGSLSIYNDSVAGGGDSSVPDTGLPSIGPGQTPAALDGNYVFGAEATAGQAFASGIYLQGAGNTLDFDTTNPTTNAATFQTMDDVIGDDTGSAAAADYTGPSSYTAGNVGISVSGAGSLILGAMNTYTGTTDIASGVLVTAAVDAISASSAVMVEAAGTLDLGGFQQDLGALTGVGAVTDNSFPVDGVINSGLTNLLDIGVGNISSVFSGTIENGDDLTALEKVGTGTFVIAGNDIYTGATTIASGTLQVGSGGTTGAISATSGVIDDGILAFDLSDTHTEAESIVGTGGLTQMGAGTTILTSSNTYTGVTTIGQGTLQLGNGGMNSTIASALIVDDSMLEFDQADTETMAGLVSGSGSLAQIGSGTTILTNDDTYTGTTTITEGTLQLGNGGIDSTVASGSIIDDGMLAFDRTDDETTTGRISGTGSLTQIGSGTTILTGANTYTGVTTVASGTLQIGNGGASGAITATSSVTDDGTVAFNLSVTQTNTESVVGMGALEQIGPGTTILTNNNIYTGVTTISQGTLQLGNGGTNSTIASASIVDDAVLAFDRADTETTTGLISGTGVVAQIGSGTTILTNSNTYSGVSILASGTLNLANAHAAGTGDITFAAGSHATLGIGVGDAPANTIIGFTPGDKFDVAGTSVAPTVNLLPGNLLLVESLDLANPLAPIPIVDSLQLNPNQSFTGYTFQANPDGSGGAFITDIAIACYAAGTRILTTVGERPVETLAIGDDVVTASGEMRPVRWLGRRSYAGRFLAANPAVQPIRFRAGSLGGGLPRRDLLVSPEHAMLLDGLLVPARCLLNGSTIVRERAVRVDYHHVELDTHDVILAEGAASETFVDDNSRGIFHNASDFAERYPGARQDARYCAPRHEHGRRLEAIRRRLAAEAREAA